MTDFYKKLNTAGKSVHMDAERKQAIRNRLVYAMNEQPLVVRQWWAIRWVQVTAACALFIFATGATTSFAANQALPGDFLYTVKIKFTEPVQGILKKTPEDRAAWEVERASRRLEEVDRLALSGELNTETQAAAEQSLNAQVERVQEKIQKVEDRGDSGAAAELHSNLTAVLNVHEGVLDTVSRKQGKDTQELKAAQSNVRSQREDSTARSANSNSGRQRAEEMLRRATAAVASIQTENIGQANAVKTAQDLLNAAQKLYDGGNYDQSFSTALKALQTAQEIRVAKGVKKRLNLEIEINAGSGNRGHGGHSDD
jgi:hypothetical protein